MPYLSEAPEHWWRPLKRRKLNTSYDMARNFDEGAAHAHGTQTLGAQQDERDESPSSDPGEKQEIRTSNREEFIQCLKRGQRTTWVPKPNFQALCAEADEQAHATTPRFQGRRDIEESRLKKGKQGAEPDNDIVRPSTPPVTIERPRSALHAGDFHHSQARHTTSLQVSTDDRLAKDLVDSPGDPASPPRSWTSSRSQRTISDSNNITQTSLDSRRRSRAPSLGSSLSSSFVMRVPTSPLVNAISNPGLEPCEGDIVPLHNQADDRARRRRTLPSHAFAQLRMSPLNGSDEVPVPMLRREASAPHQTHQSRRSLNSFTYQPASTSQSIFPSRQRRLSHASDISPLQRTSMVGSFEESILRGRMSTAPSRPLDFLAEIGVMGKGECSPKLKCPAHAKIPFPAVFYNYPSTGGPRSISDDNPSPYVGTIDLCHNLKPVEQPRSRQRRGTPNDPEALIAELTGPENTSIGKALAARGSRQASADADGLGHDIGGAYRVPQQGQLQVIIKNPNNTAVKLFLIPYDLEGMLAGTKTFVRQRSFSSGPAVENILSNQPIQDPLSGKQILRYLIHLKFCCPTKGRYYLYDTMRLVFANRVPDGKEKLRNEIQLPEPRYSPFVPGQSSSRRQSLSTGTAPSTDPFGSYSSTPSTPSVLYDLADGISTSTRRHDIASSPIPFHLSKTSTDELHGNLTADKVEREVEGGATDKSGNDTPRPLSPEVYGFDKSGMSQRGSPVPWGSRDLAGLRSPSPAPPAHGSGILSQKLRQLDRTKQACNNASDAASDVASKASGCQ